MVIYKATNKVNGKEYIGRTINSLRRRRNDHISAANRGKTNSYFHKAIRKYGKDNFEWRVIHTCEEERLLNDLEIFYIGYYDTYNTGYNLTYGGDTTTGWIPKQETKDKISKANTGRKMAPRSQAYRDAISKRMTGKKQSFEHIENLRKARTGSHPNLTDERRAAISKQAYNMGKMKKTKEHKEKLSQIFTGVNNQNKGYIVVTPVGDVLYVECMAAFCKVWQGAKLIPQVMCSMASVGKRDNHKGYKCYYKENYNE